VDKRLPVGAGQREVLLLAFYFPPSTIAGTFRTLQFARYLPEFGWRPRVITVAHRTGERLDPQLSAEVPPGTAVLRLPCFDPLSAWRRIKRTRAARVGRASQAAEESSGRPGSVKRFIGDALHFPDDDVGWIPFALLPALWHARRRSVAAIWSTGPPWATHLLALLLKRLSGKPWVADFRDPWARNPARTWSVPAFQRLSERLERKVARSADVLVGVTQPLADSLRRNLPPGKPDPVVLPNGWDAAQFDGLERKPPHTFTLTYAGALYNVRNPEHLLAGIGKFVHANGASRRNIRVLFVGSAFEEHEALVRRLGLEGVVQSIRHMPHREVLRTIASSHVLVDLLTNDQSRAYCIPCKLYEYLAARRPILMLAGRGPASEMVARSGVGTVAPPDDADAIAQAIERLHAEHKVWRDVQPDEALLSEHEARHLTARLAGLLDSLVGGSRR